jgi:glycosyltransferase involved in cell wall biosynthesis
MSDAATTVSVVMPVKNGARYIAEAIRSALQAGDKIVQLVVVDDASTDGTLAAVRAIDDRRIRIVPNHSCGLPAGRNTGAAIATGEWLYFLDSDDRLRPGALDTLLAAASTAPEAAVIYGDYERIDAGGRTIGSRAAFRTRRKPSGDVLASILTGNFMVVGAQIVRHEAFRRAGGFDETLGYCEDWHFWCRVAAFAPFLHVAGCHVLDYRIHGASMMHATPRPFRDLAPAVEAVFADERIVGRFSPAERGSLREAARASMMTYVATEAIRLRAYRTAASSTLRAIGQRPRGAPRVLAKVLGTFAGL